MKKLLFLLVSLSVFTVGCKKDITITENVAVQESVQGLKGVKIENDYFVFQNLAHFINSMKELNHETYDNQMFWYASQPVETMQKSYIDMLKSYELLADEPDLNKVVSFKKKNSDIAFFVETGEVSINAPTQFAQIVNRKGLFKIGNTLVQVNKDKTIYILDGDKSKIEQGLRMLPSQSTANIIVSDETPKINLLRGACFGQPSQNIIISDFSSFIQDNSGDSKYKATSRLTITNWTYPLNDGSLKSNHFVSLDASSKSYKRGFLGRWYSTSVSKTCSGSIFIKARPTCLFGSPCTPNVVVNNEPYSDTYQASDVNFPIAGPYSYHRRYIPSLGTAAGEFGESCSDISISTTFPLGTTYQTMQ